MRQGGIRARSRMPLRVRTSSPLRASGGLPAVMPRARSPVAGPLPRASGAQEPERGKAQEVYFAAPATGVYGSMNSPSAFTGSHFS